MGDVYDESQCILEPTERDVLCGRGGMSNHHQGNEWYRRLIRSNRPLYRACPKHTKLLVSKAIVQAVEEQGGRFLERSRKTGMWYQVPYKRAVDKTSQGLRERDKDEPAGPEITSLPASLQAPSGGKIPKPNLKALAQVAMAHAGMPIPKAKPPPPPLPKMQQQQQQRMQQQQMFQQQQQQQQQQQRRGLFFSMGTSAAAVPSGGDPLDAPPPQPGLLSSQSSMFRLFSRFGGGGDTTTTNNRRQSFNNDASFNPLSSVPSIPSMGGPGLTSFMGSFGVSGFLGGESSNNNNISSNNTNNNMGGSVGMNSMDMNNNINMPHPGMSVNMNNTNNNMNNMHSMNSMAAMNNGMGMNMNMNSNNIMNQTSNPNFGALNSQQQQQQQQMQQQMQLQQQLQQQQMQQQQQQQQHSQQNTGGAPTLTRLTTQVSDWLTSFWPVGKGEDPNNRGRAQAQTQAQAQAQGVNNSMGQLGSNNMEIFSGGGGGGGNNNMNRVARESFSRSIQQDQINTMIPPMAIGGGPNSGGGGASIMDNSMPLPAQLPPVRLNSGGGSIGGDDSGDDDGDDDILQPAALESSVSTTLLKLASTPSKILAGISTFFSSEPSGFQGPNQQQRQQTQQGSQSFSVEPDPLMDIPPPPPPGGLGVPVGRRSSRRSSDLLDDYEETELEARMRAVAGN